MGDGTVDERLEGGCWVVDGVLKVNQLPHQFRQRAELGIFNRGIPRGLVQPVNLVLKVLQGRVEVLLPGIHQVEDQLVDGVVFGHRLL